LPAQCAIYLLTAADGSHAGSEERYKRKKETHRKEIKKKEKVRKKGKK
jgi:hypothetical protein